MNSKEQGNIGEISVIKRLIKDGYEVYLSVLDNSSYDMLAVKDGLVSKVEVKSTNVKGKSINSYVVQIRKVRPNKSENKIYHFDNSKVDILAIYVVDLDEVILMDAKNIINKSTLTIKLG